MTEKSEWQEANRKLIAEERLRLGDPPTAEELAAFRRGELSAADEDRIRDLLVAYPDLARMYNESAPDTPQPGDADHLSPSQVAASWDVLQQQLPVRAEAPRGRLLMFPIPTAIAAAFAVVFFGLFVQADSRARYYAQQGKQPRILAAPQELDPDGSRGPSAGTMLRKDGEAYLLKPRLINQVRHPHYQLELQDANDKVLWTNNTAQPDEDDAFQIVVPHAFLREGEKYRLFAYGVDGDTRALVGEYDLTVPAD